MERTILLAPLLACAVQNACAQGCSDAGVCTAGAIGELRLWQDSVPDAMTYRSDARLAYSYGIGDLGTTVQQILPELNIGIGERISIQAKVPFLWTKGDLGDNGGIGDAVATVSFAFVEAADRGLTGMLGMRLPTGSTDARAPVLADTGNHVLVALDAGSLPMVYQTGLGTTDLLAGITARKHRWTIALAYQHVLHNGNNNRFTPEAWSGDDRAQGYDPSYCLDRQDDAVGRVQYTYGCGRLALQPGLLAIYHVADDTVLEDPSADLSMPPQRTVVEGSQGLTLNGTLDLRFKLSDRWALEASAGMPFITREARPDGLTRELVVNGGLRFRF